MAQAEDLAKHIDIIKTKGPAQYGYMQTERKALRDLPEGTILSAGGRMFKVATVVIEVEEMNFPDGSTVIINGFKYKIENERVVRS